MAPKAPIYYRMLFASGHAYCMIAWPAIPATRLPVRVPRMQCRISHEAQLIQTVQMVASAWLAYFTLVPRRFLEKEDIQCSRMQKLHATTECRKKIYNHMIKGYVIIIFFNVALGDGIGASSHGRPSSSEMPPLMQV